MGHILFFKLGKKILAYKFGIHKKVEPIDTKIIAIIAGLRIAMEKASTRFATNMIVYTDNQIVAGVVSGNNIPTCRKELLEIRETQSKSISRVRLPHNQAGNITAGLIQGHLRHIGKRK